MKNLKNLPCTIIVVNLILIASTIAAWHLVKSLAKREATRLFNDEATIIESWITNRLESYKTIAYGLQAFWAGSEAVTQEEWQVYIETLKIKERFPGITSINFVRRVDGNYIITFAYPPEREVAIGTNVVTLPERLETINKAIDSDSVAISDKVLLIADQSPGFIMCAPVYKKGSLEGLVTLAFRSEQVFKDLFDAHDTFPHLDFELYKDQILDENHIIYDHDYSHFIHKIKGKGRLETTRVVISDKEIFTLLVSSKPTFGLRTLEVLLPNIVLATGLVFSFLIFIFALSEFRKLQKNDKNSGYRQTKI